MTVFFPALKPSSRQVTQGQFATKRFNSIAGTGTTRIYGSKPFNSTIELEYQNRNDVDVLDFITSYEEARGSFDSLALPDELWDGMDVAMRTQLEGTYIWRYASPPSVTSVAPGLSSIQITLEGQRDG